ncbi:hypothetical protein B0H34DRAFT_802726 [Crassisporium funariophilum]|nr:hypothetical protein B0H34DRAFT_802726 [Crassisporium funariophilum]
MFFFPPLRLYVFRIIVFLSVLLIILVSISIASDPEPSESQEGAKWLALSAVVFVHHTATVVKWRYIYGAMDVALLSCEIIAWFLFGLSKIVIDRWSNEVTIIFVAAAYILLVALFLSWLFRLATILVSKGQALKKPFDLLSGCGGTIGQGMGVRLEAMGEAVPIRALRGVIGAFFLIVICSFALVEIVLEPVKETALVPTKDLHTTDIAYDFDMEIPVWSIVAFIDMRWSVSGDVETFKGAIKVTPLWDDSSSTKPSCVHVPGNKTFGGTFEDVYSEPYIQTITIYCPSRVEFAKDASEAFMTTPTSLTSPDLLVSVDFTKLGVSSPSDLESLVDARLRAVSIVVGMTNDTAAVLANSEPTPLLLGVNLVGSVSTSFRRRFTNPRVASWGFFTSSHTFLTTEISSLYPDPSPSPLIVRSPTTATLRLFGQNDISEWKIVGDYRDKSVWSGLSEVGGFWTFLNGVFAVVFGSGLLLIVFGIKPLSAFTGIAHMFQVPRTRRNLHEDFPLIAQEEQARKADRGLLAFLHEHFVDLEAIDLYSTYNNSSPNSCGGGSGIVRGHGQVEGAGNGFIEIHMLIQVRVKVT